MTDTKHATRSALYYPSSVKIIFFLIEAHFPRPDHTFFAGRSSLKGKLPHPHPRGAQAEPKGGAMATTWVVCSWLRDLSIMHYQNSCRSIWGGYSVPAGMEQRQDFPSHDCFATAGDIETRSYKNTFICFIVNTNLIIACELLSFRSSLLNKGWYKGKKRHEISSLKNIKCVFSPNQ